MRSGVFVILFEMNTTPVLCVRTHTGLYIYIYMIVDLTVYVTACVLCPCYSPYAIIDKHFRVFLMPACVLMYTSLSADMHFAFVLAITNSTFFSGYQNQKVK